MQRFLPLLLTGSLLLAQPAASIFQKAPPAIDEALRKRVGLFYQAYVDGKARRALELVAEESEDIFFNAQKPKLKSFEIQQVNYAKDFQSATVMILAEQDVVMPMGGGAQLMKLPIESHWKLADNAWLWYVPKNNCAASPFGCVETGAAPAGPKMSAEEIAKRIQAVNQSNLGKDFGFEKTEVALGAEREAEVQFFNSMPGWVTIRPEQGFTDPEVELMGGEVLAKPQGSTKVVFRLRPGVKVQQGRVLRFPVMVQPFNKRVQLGITLKPAA